MAAALRKRSLGKSEEVLRSLAKSFIASPHAVGGYCLGKLDLTGISQTGPPTVSLLLINQVGAWDRAFSLWVHAHSAPWLDQLMLTLTYGGDWRFLLLVTLASVVFLFRWQLGKRAPLLLSLAFSLSYLANPLLKSIFQRQRPDLWEVFARPSSYSFPSGHAMSAMMVYGIAAFLFAQRYPQHRRVWLCSAASWIFLIGFSRIYLGVHWLSDVVAGFAIGFVFVYALVRWYKLSEATATSPDPHSPLR